MHHFQYKGEELYCEDVPVKLVAEQVGTPCYIYSLATLKHHFVTFDSAFADARHLTCYSVKANSNIAILKLFGSMGGGVDIVSGGELYRALKAQIPSERIVYSGVGKTVEEIDFALREKILMFNIESTQELEQINRRAEAMNTKASVSLRVNPDIDPNTHPYISTGMKKNKFGISTDSALRAFEDAKNLKNIDMVGLDCHIGSQLTDVTPFVDALKRLHSLIERLRLRGADIRYLDLGGGLGIVYDQEAPPQPHEYARALLHELGDIDCTLIFEPGRVIVGNAGIFVTKVLYTKRTPAKNFVITDGAMNDLIRPSLYGSYHSVQPVVRNLKETEIVDVVGPICESGDFLARDRGLPISAQGDYLAVMSAGAYGFSMSSNYNSRPRVPEVLVNGGQFSVIRRRETWEDLVRPETVPDFLEGGLK
ncbi:MAG: diaminopimelate decarboxylase [Deltaproteobacteria bacterium]|jgi:diaminopimelate decarboxylase|nr:diaminopimelate decarboxylase [Deltaproteobacteria bacterium]MDA8307812.1 diaminopimelate decarboxylase [Deltaproteobacteria bacterium]